MEYYQGIGSSLEEKQMNWIVAGLIFGLTFYLMPQLVQLISPRQSSLNYLNQEIPLGLGVVFLITSIPGILLGIILQTVSALHGTVFLILVLSFGILGLIDDTLGSRQARGFIGHFRALTNGTLTTGALKAIFGGLVGLLVAWVTSEGLSNIVINALNIALFANLTNLLDVRPGRAGKFFILTAGLLLIFGNQLPMIMYLMGAVLAYLSWDLKGRVMMGDVGSNVLGAVLGFGLIDFSFWVRLLVLVGLGMINFYSERFSLTQVIEKTPVLNFIDQIGRERTQQD